MEAKHRYVVGGLFFSYGLILSFLGFIILSAHVEGNFRGVMVLFGIAIPSLMGGYNLLTGKPAAHAILAIAALVNLISFPYGTVLSIYYYWYWKYQCGAPNPVKHISSPNTIAAQ